ncbi:hypothetical protein [Streptomyces sp. NPDC005407]
MRLLLATELYRKEPDGPYARLLSPLPLHELFALARQLSWRDAADGSR